MKYLQWLKDHKDKLGDGADTIISSVEAAIAITDPLGITVLANDNKVPEYLPKSRFDEINGQKTMQKEQIDELNKKLKELDTASGEVTKLQSQIETMKATLGTTEGENTDLKKQLQKLANSSEKLSTLQQELTSLQGKDAEWATKYEKSLIASRAQLEAIKLKAINPDNVIKLLDLSDVKVAGDDVIGLAEKLTKLKETDAYLFSSDEPALPPAPNPPAPGSKGNHPKPPAPGQKTYTKADLANMSPQQINENWAVISAQMEADTLQ